jgi:hypothetical protein
MDTPIENIAVLLEGSFSWPAFFTLVAFQVALFFLLRLADRLLARTDNWGKALSIVKKWAHYTLLIYEPLALILIASAFVLINPPFHGLMLAMVLLLAFGHVRNYISGRLLLLNPLFAPGRRMNSGLAKGIITNIGRQGVSLQTQEGIQFVRYAHLTNQGFTIDPGDEIGGYFNLKILPGTSLQTSDPLLHFQDLLSTAPYLDRKYKPEFNIHLSNDGGFQVKVLLHEENHLYELLSLVKEWGYEGEVLAD